MNIDFDVVPITVIVVGLFLAGMHTTAIAEQRAESHVKSFLNEDGTPQMSYLNVQCEYYDNRYLEGYHCYASQVYVENGEVRKDKSHAAVVECEGGIFRIQSCTLESTWEIQTSNASGNDSGGGAAR